MVLLMEIKKGPQESDEDGTLYDDPDGSVWIVAVDIDHVVSVIQAPSIRYSFFDNGKDAESIGLPYEQPDMDPGVYKWVCGFKEEHHWDGDIDYFFTLKESELLWEYKEGK